jgi:hypothetical protein
VTPPHLTHGPTLWWDWPWYTRGLVPPQGGFVTVTRCDGCGRRILAHQFGDGSAEAMVVEFWPCREDATTYHRRCWERAQEAAA